MCAILKDLVDLNQNIEAVRTLMNIYGTLGDNQGYMEMKICVIRSLINNL